jgi:hypothetical protein
MPEKETIEHAKKDLQSGKSPTTAAGEFVRQEMHHIREGKHGAKNAKQAIAIGLSEARRAGVDIPDKPKRSGTAAKRAGKAATGKRAAAKVHDTPASPKRARAALKRLKREPRAAASHRALSRQARSAAKKRPARARSAAARKAARTRARSSR